MIKYIIIILPIYMINCSPDTNPQDRIIHELPDMYNDLIRSEILTEIDFDQKYILLDKAPKDTTLIVRFEIKNIGSESLVITGVYPDCVCTGYTLINDEIGVGEVSFLDLELNTEGLYGQITSFTTIIANTKERFHSLRVTANIQ